MGSQRLVLSVLLIVGVIFSLNQVETKALAESEDGISTETWMNNAQNWARDAAGNTKNWTESTFSDTKDWAKGAAKDTKKWAEGAAKDTKSWAQGAAEDTRSFFKNIFG